MSDAARGPQSRSGANVVVAGVTKSFNGVQVLKGVDLSVEYGEIHGLLGQNGSGKSTLIKVLSGTYHPEAGTVTAGGARQELPLVAFADVGFSFVHQDLGLIEDLTVLDNFLLNRTARSHARRLRWAHDRQATREVLLSHDLDLDVDAKVSTLEATDRALLAIVRAVENVRHSSVPGLLVLDEPTVFLPREGVERLFTLARSVAAAGTSILFVSHDIDEVRELTSRVTVLRDGAVAGTARTDDLSDDDLVSMIVGQRLARHQDEMRSHDESGRVVVRVDRMRTNLLDGVDLDVREGEVLGVTGLAGSGFEHIPYAVFGALDETSGTVVFGDDPVDLARHTPAQALRHGVAFVPGDRKREGAAVDLSVADNITTQALERHRPWRLRRRALAGLADRLVEEYDVRPRNPHAIYGSLSGGNQQKALMAKWLDTEPEVLLLHEPTQGVDVGAREQIFAALDAARSRRTAVVCASSDCEQLARICDRVVVIARGRVQAVLTGSSLTKDHIVETVYNTATTKESA